MKTLKRPYLICWQLILASTTLLLLTPNLNAQTIKGTIIDAVTKEPIPYTNVLIKETGTGTSSDFEGNYKLEVPPGKYTLQASTVGYKTTSKAVTIETSSVELVNFELNNDITGLDEHVVLGTRRIDRTVIESAVPIDLISPKEIEASGFTQTVDLLQSLIPSYNAFNNPITDGTDYVRPANLRGLGPEHVLVLINGKRRHISSLVHVNANSRGSVGVDLNTIPPSAIERIEVLRDGAAAQYGSDAIAGVINIVLKKNTSLEASLTYGQNFSSEERGYREEEGLLPGQENSEFRTGYFNKTWTEDHEKVTHTDGQNFIAHVGKGFNIGKATVFLSGQYRKQGGTNRSNYDPRYQFFGTDLATDTLTDDPIAMDNPNQVRLDPREYTFDRLNHWYGRSQLDDISFFMNGNVDIKQDNELYFFGGFSWREGLGPCYYRRALDNRTVRSEFPEGFLPQINPIVMDGSLAAGYKGKFGKWNYDISETFGMSSFNFRVTNTINTSLGNRTDGLGQKNFFDDGTLSFTQSSTNLDVNRQIDMGLASPLNFAFGGEYRFENYKEIAGEALSYADGNKQSGGIKDGPNKGKNTTTGCQCLPGFSPDNASNTNRSNIGFYSDLEADLIETLTLGIAGRFENYSDFGSSINGKISSRWQILEEFALRGAISTGFRAPALGQQNYYSLASNPIANVLVESGTFPVHTDVAKALGATDLKSEKSVNLSAGITFKKNDFSLTVDAYRIILNDRIILSEDFIGKKDSTGKDLLEEFFTKRNLSATSGRFFTNALNTQTDGIDITGRHAIRFNNGNVLRLTLSANFTKTKITNTEDIDTPDELKAITETPLLGRVNQIRMEQAAPRSVFNFILNYDHGHFGFMLRNTHYGNIIEPSEIDQKYDQTFSAKLINDAEINYKFAQNKMTVALGTNNMFNIYPEKKYKATSFDGIFPYSGLVPYGFTGRYMYIRLKLNI